MQYTLGLQTRGFTGPLNRAGGAVGSFASRAGMLAAKVAAIAGPVLSVAGAFATLRKSMIAAADMQTLETAFIPILGSAQAAEDRLKELSAFAASTPFQLPDIANASRTLETLTQGALSTGDGLRLVGDLASGTNQPFDALAVTVGRLYDALQNGGNIGREAARLQEMGIIGGDVRRELEALHREGGRGEEAWAVATEAMGRFSGSMELQSQTWNGLTSTLKDNISLMLAEFGKPIIDALTPYLTRMIAMVGQLKDRAEEFGRSVVRAVKFLQEAFSSGVMFDVVQTGLILAFRESVNFLYAAFVGTLRAVGQMFIEIAKNVVMAFQILTTPGFWQGLGNVLAGIALGWVAILKNGLAEIMELARPLAKLFRQEDMIDDGQKALRAGADMLMDEAGREFAKAMEEDRLGGVFDKAGNRITEAFGAIGGAFEEGMNDAGQILDNSGAAQDFARAMADLGAIAFDLGKDAIDPIEDAGEKAADAVKHVAERIEVAAAALQVPEEEPEEEEPRRRGLFNAAESYERRMARRSGADVAKRPDGDLKVSPMDRLAVNRAREANDRLARLPDAVAAQAPGQPVADPRRGRDPGRAANDAMTRLLTAVTGIDTRLQTIVAT